MSSPAAVVRRRVLLLLVAVLAALLPALLASPATGSDEGLVWSASRTRTPASPLEGASLSGAVYVVLLAPDAVQVRFYLDDPQRQRTPVQVEKNAPWDLLGSDSSGTYPRALDTTTLASGPHSVTAAATLADGSVRVLTSSFVVGSQTPSSSPTASPTASATVSPTPDPTVSSSTTPSPTPTSVGPTETVSPRPPDQVHLAWVEDPSTTLTVTWRTTTPVPSVVGYVAPGAASEQAATGRVRATGSYGYLHEVTLRGLQPATEYRYEVPGDGGATSGWLSAGTAPGRGGPFDALFFADTGIAGRTDGLTTGTLAVRDAMLAQDPDLLLGGGDYAYFNTETRFPTLDSAIDAWFLQTEPLARRAPLMPTYGNHEALLGEGFAPWVARFPTPAGHDGRRSYSFDVGDVHFTSLFAVEETKGLSSSALAWLDDDLARARARGQRWLVPFMHVPSFSDGKNHPTNLALRQQLGPLFEKHRVPLVLTTHDQSYERTYALRDVPATNTPTTTAKGCLGASEGTTWVKVSPAGKLSNKNGSFSTWRTVPPPAWTAVRTNTQHHWARLAVDPAAGALRVQAWGLLPGGSPWVVDSWEHRLQDDCPPELSFSASEVPLTLLEGSSGSARVGLSSSGGATPADLWADAPWVTPPAAALVPGEVELAVDTAGLAPGRYRATVQATAPGAREAAVHVLLTVARPDRVLWSASPTRSAAEPLRDARLSGTVHVFAEPGTAVSQVRFWLDDPTRSGTPRQVERTAPYDLAGGSTSTANGLDTRSLSEGSHVLTTEATRGDGSVAVMDTRFDVVR